MDEKIYKITLADGNVLDNLTMNGNNFICVVSSTNFANVNNNGNTNYNNASNSNGVRPDSLINQRRRRCYPFRQGEITKPETIY